MPSDPLISTIVPVYNGEAYLAETLKNLRSMDWSPHEVVVVDDGSTDRSAEIVSARDDVLLVSQPNRGVGAALNAGIRASKGSLIAFSGADDLAAADKLAVLYAAMEEDSALDLVFGMVRNFPSPDRAAAVEARYKVDETPMPGYVPGGMLVRREAFDRTGPFPEGLVLGEFIAWYGQVKDLGLKERLLDNVIYHRRIHGDNLAIRARARYGDYLTVMRARIRAGRQGGAGNA